MRRVTSTASTSLRAIYIVMAQKSVAHIVYIVLERRVGAISLALETESDTQTPGIGLPADEAATRART